MCPSLRRELRMAMGVCSPRPDGLGESSKYGLAYGLRRTDCSRSRRTEVYGRCDPCLREDPGQED